MAVKLALLKLFDAVEARFVAEQLTAINVFGWRTSAQRLAPGGRIAWIPGDLSGKVGDIAPPRRPGNDAGSIYASGARGSASRPLGTLRELVTVEISAFDESAPEDERLQYAAVRELYDAWFRAVYLAAYGTFEIVDSEWLLEKKERRHGAALRVVAIIEAMLPDAPVSSVDLLAANAVVSELDVDETVTATP
jgi:hypothetical protein